jgi:UDP-2,4-diacetamido-2,4,6-trideoxy-beta-L-altropyranose hydrolase
MTAGTLNIRADASIAIGTGHVMRCLALGQAWQDAGGRVVFATIGLTSPVEQRLRSEGIEIVKFNGAPGSVQDASQLEELACAHHADWVVVDGYQFEAEYQRKVKDAGLKLLFIDDNGHAKHYLADLVLNQNAHGCEDLYQSRAPRTKLLLGPRFALLRREFQGWRQWKRETVPVARKVLVTMGGSDPDNVTAIVVRALQLASIESLEAKVVVGVSNPCIGSLERVAGQSQANVSVVKDATNMPELMAWADVAISGAGSTCWEMCLLGLPAIVIDLAENQRIVAKELDRRGVAIHLGAAGDATPEKIVSKLRWLLDSIETRTALSMRARELVDGNGAERVVSAMRGEMLQLRRVEEGDCRLLWEWANDPVVRAASFSSEFIPWEHHQDWFNAKLADPNAVLYLAANPDNVSIGQVRYQVEGPRAQLSVSLAPEFRGKGYGNRIVAMATEELFRSTSVTTIDAYVKAANEASLQLFLRAGFKQQDSRTIHGQQAVHFILQKNGNS